MNKFVTIFLAVSSMTSAFAIEEIKPTTRDGLYYPRWDIGDFSIEVRNECRIMPGAGLSYPRLTCSPQHVALIGPEKKQDQKSKDLPSRYVTLSAGGITVNTAEMIGEGRLLFGKLSNLPNADVVLVIEETAYKKAEGELYGEYVKSKVSTNLRLLEFADRSRDFAQQLEQHYLAELKKAESALTTRIFVIVSVLALALLAIVAALRFVLSSSKKAIARRRENIEERRIRRIAEDEAIRTTVRKSVEDSDEIDLSALKERIKEAIDKGDIDAAGTLTSMLKNHASRRGTTITATPASEQLELSTPKN